MNAQITPRRALAFIGLIALVFCAGYGVGAIGAKTVNYLTDDTPTVTAHS